MWIRAIPCLADNYAYLVSDGKVAAVVDPGEAAPIEAALAEAGVVLRAIWLTHHHPDHTGGVDDLLASRPDADIGVVAGEVDADKIAHVTRVVREGDTVRLGPIVATMIHNPGHTIGAMSFHLRDHAAVFTGDTLFAAGCGRVFEGTAEMMFASLQKLAALPPETKVYFGHEYTAGNLKFAAAVEPDNAAVRAWQARLVAPSTPSTIADERAANPFVRAANAAAFHERRERKNNFK